MLVIPKKLSQGLYSFELHLVGRQDILSKLNFLKKTQYNSQKKIDELQWKKFKSLLEHAYRTTSFYKQKYVEAGIEPSDIKTRQDLKKIPAITREDILNNADGMVSIKFDKQNLNKAMSSGSTGQPLTLYQTKEFYNWGKAHQLRNYNWCGGYEIGDRFALLWGQNLYFKLKTLREKIENFSINRMELNTFILTEPLLLEYSKKLQKFKPKLISTYVSSILLIGQVIEKYGLKGIKPKAIQTTSENLGPFERKKIEEYFNCEVYDKYGSRETNVISAECNSHQNMHINSENVLFEVVKGGEAAAPLESGDVLVTNLNNYGMPLIRYKNNDVAALVQERCNCGINLPLMKPVIGRKSDLVVSPDGNFVDSYFFSYILSKEKVEQFQLIQNTKKNLKLVIVPTKELDKMGFEARISNEIHKIAHPDFNINFVYVNKIPKERSGKFKCLKINVKHRWQP